MGEVNGLGGQFPQYVLIVTPILHKTLERRQAKQRGINVTAYVAKIVNERLAQEALSQLCSLNKPPTGGRRRKAQA